MPHNLISAGLKELELLLDERQLSQIQTHFNLIKKWHKQINLVSFKDERALVTHHVLDSLALEPLLRASKNILDIGTGAGFPGIPLAAVCPDIEFSLLDSRQRRVEFLRLVVAQAKLENVQVATSRIENYYCNLPVQNTTKFDTLVARAVTSLAKLVELTSHLHFSGQRLLVMKGRYPDEELEALEQHHGSMLSSIRVESLHVPFLDAERHAVIIEF